jgi:hypothetical protein
MQVAVDGHAPLSGDAASKALEEVAEVQEKPTATHVLAKAAAGASGAADEQAHQKNGAAFKPAARVEEEYVVLTEEGPAISALAKARHASAGGGTDFCGNLARIAFALEELAMKRTEQFPCEALALLLRGLELLEKALKLSIAEEETSAPLRQAFRRMFEASEAAAGQIRTPAASAQCGMEAFHEPARPNHVIFEFAVQQAKDAAVALSKGHEVGGWESFCHEKLSLALLLLDLLGSEAEGEDVTVISSFTAPITKLVDEIERLALERLDHGKLVSHAADMAASHSHPLPSQIPIC